MAKCNKEPESITKSCLPCACIGSNCCGCLYWSDDGKVLCNECDREFEVSLKDVIGNLKWA